MYTLFQVVTNQRYIFVSNRKKVDGLSFYCQRYQSKTTKIMFILLNNDNRINSLQSENLQWLCFDILYLKNQYFGIPRWLGMEEYLWPRLIIEFRS